MAKLRWEPWEDYKNVTGDLPIKGPPCHRCQHWRPMAVWMVAQFTGIACCQGDEMFRDFSCYEARDTLDKD